MTTTEVPDNIKVQMATRISYRTRVSLDEFISYMDLPLIKRPLETEDWPSNIVDVIEDALTTFFAEHPRHPRKGVKDPRKKPAAKATGLKKAQGKTANK